MQNSKEHIRHCLLYEYQLGNSATEATRNICQAVGQDSTTLRTALNCFDRFRNQDYSLQDMARSGRPTTINLDELKQLLEKDPSLTTTAVASKLEEARIR
jgi:histone-lysine N-methyltransferase SETMAR